MLLPEPIRHSLFNVLYQTFPRVFPTMQSAKRTDYGVSMLLCHRDMTMVIYCLSSLFYHLGRALPVYIIDDGTLTSADRQRLQALFTVQFESKHKAVSKIGKQFPKTGLARYIQDPATHIKKMKLAAFFLSPFEKTIFVEPDLIFNQQPKEIVTFLTHGGLYYGSLQDGTYDFFLTINYTEMVLHQALYNTLKIDANPVFNGGLMLVSKDRITSRMLSNMEKMIAEGYQLGYARAFYFEEVVLSTLFEQKRATLLPLNAYINFTSGEEFTQLNTPDNLRHITMFHFTTYARPIIIYQSVKQALKTNFFRHQ